jgi:predicted extracellular nuclease
MKGVLTALLGLGVFMLSGITIFDIQYTTIPGSDNTYPSKYAGKTVTVEGVVTATNHKNGGFFISEPANGPWRGMFVRTELSRVKTGDRIVIRGTVAEYFGMTCLKDIISLRIIDSGYPLPLANQITTGQMTDPDQAEAYEGTLVKIQNASIVQNQSNSHRLAVNDGSGACAVSDLLSYSQTRSYKSGDCFASVTGVACYAFGEYSINPRVQGDIILTMPVFNQNRSWGRIKSIYR